MKLVFGALFLILLATCGFKAERTPTESPSIDSSYPYSDYFYSCTEGRYSGWLDYVSSQHPISECIAKCSNKSQAYSVLTYVPNLKETMNVRRPEREENKACCLACSCTDSTEAVSQPSLDPDTYCNTNFTEGTSGVCWSNCYDSVYCSYGMVLNGQCPTSPTTTTTTTTSLITTPTACMHASCDRPSFGKSYMFMAVFVLMIK